MRRICLVLVTAAALVLPASAGSTPSSAALARAAADTSTATCVSSAIHRSLVRASSRYVSSTRWRIRAKVRGVKRGCGGRRTISAYPEVNFRRAASKRSIRPRRVNHATEIVKRYKLTRDVCRRRADYVRGVVEFTYVRNGKSYGYRRYVSTRNKPC